MYRKKLLDNSKKNILKKKKEVNKMENKIITVVENKELIEAIKENIFQWNNIKVEDDSEIVINEIFDNVYDVEVENYNYIVSNDYAALEQLATERNVEIIEDCGLTQNLILEAELQGLIDTWYFEEYFDELHQFEAYDEGLEYIITDEQDELLEAGEITEQEIRDNLYDSLQASIKGNELEEYKFQFGEEEFQRVLIEHNLIDLTALAKWCVDMDGVAHTLATWDGEETETNGYYFYQC